MLRWSRAVLLVTAATSVVACGGATSTGVEAPQRVVLVTIDTLRADHVSSYGYPIETTPFFDSLAAEGTVFERAYAHSATTKPSHSSMFTSLYPMQHGVQNNGLVLDVEFETMAEVLAAAGFETAAFVSTDAPLGGNVNQGFSTWDQHTNDRSVDGARKLYRSAADTVDAAIAWLDSRSPADRFFLWVHVYDPHKPLEPPDDALEHVRRLIARYGDDAYTELLLGRDIPADTERGREDVVLYDAEIWYADRELQRLHEAAAASGLNDDAVWVVTSDHGQGLGAHDWFGHSKQIYNAQLHVPLLFWFGDERTPQRVTDRVVEHVDLLPTLTAMLGVSLSQLMPMQGTSLLGHMNGGRPPVSKPFAFGERSRYLDANPRRQERGNYEEGARYSLQDLEYKYLLFTEGDDEFYDLRTDPYERNNLIAAPEFADRMGQLRDVLAQMIATMPSDREAQAVSPEDIERLRALGYIQ